MNINEIDIIKIGGSVITDKSYYLKLREEELVKICQQLRAWKNPYIIVHGAGSFGHIVAQDYSINDGFTDKSQLEGIIKIRQDMSFLTQKIVSCLVNQDVKAMSFQTSALTYIKTHQDEYFWFPVEKALSFGITPVLSGDIIFTEETGFTILSGDHIINHLVQYFNVNQVVFLTSVDGLFEETTDSTNDKLVNSIKYGDFDSIHIKDMKSDITDVTGSMRGKLTEIGKMIHYVKRVVLLNGFFPERLELLKNEKDVVSTIIFGKKTT